MSRQRRNLIEVSALNSASIEQRTGRSHAKDFILTVDKPPKMGRDAVSRGLERCYHVDEFANLRGLSV
jgi:hypothetical protein